MQLLFVQVRHIVRVLLTPNIKKHSFLNSFSTQSQINSKRFCQVA